MRNRVTNYTYKPKKIAYNPPSSMPKYLNGEGIDNKLRVQTGSTVNYFLTDHLGSTIGLTDSTGSLTASNQYDSFGNPINTTFPSRYQFTGREYDKLNGLYYYRARMYDPVLGRFISEDPIGFQGGDVNLYGYVGNNPVHFTDPMGLYPSWWVWNVHKTITERALEGRANPSQVSALAGEQGSWDAATQEPAYAPWHAMARPGQSAEAARVEANRFVRNRICVARNLAARGFQADAMAYLAQAIHTLQDHASPAHHPFKEAWPDTVLARGREWLPFGHYHREKFVPGPLSAADDNTKRVWDYFTGKSKMPKDFFNNAYDTRFGTRYSPYRQRY